MAPRKPIPKTHKDLVDKPISKIKKVKKKKYKSFSIYLYKLLRSINNDNCGISTQSMLIMNNFVNDMLEKIAMEAARLATKGLKTTIGSREIQAATKLLIPGELGKHAQMEAMKAMTLYQKSQD